MATKCFAVLNGVGYTYLTEDPITLDPRAQCAFVTVDDNGLGGNEYETGASVSIQHGMNAKNIRDALVDAIHAIPGNAGLQVVWLDDKGLL